MLQIQKSLITDNEGHFHAFFSKYRILTNHVTQVSATPLCCQRGQENKCPKLSYDVSSSNFYNKLSTEERKGILRNATSLGNTHYTNQKHPYEEQPTL